MSRRVRFIAIVGYAWLAAWGRSVVLAAPTLVVLILLAQLPRIAAIQAAFRRADAEALADYVAFVSSFHANLLLGGGFLALGLGATVTSRRSLSPAILQIAARPVSRAEILCARLAAHGLVLVSFWLLPASALALLRRALGLPLGIEQVAYAAPLLVHSFLLVLGSLLGTRLSVLPATFAGCLLTWAFVFLGDGSASGVLGETLGSICDSIIPPLAELLDQAAAPFASADRHAVRLLSWARMLAWIGIAGLLAEECFARLDLSARPD